MGLWEADRGIKNLMQTIHKEDKGHVGNQVLTVILYAEGES